jgi:hypothetical protein
LGTYVGFNEEQNMDDFFKKIRKVGKGKKLIQKAGGTVLSELADMARSFVQKPAVEANFKHLFFPKKTGVYSVQKVKVAEENADWIVNYFKENRLKPSRIGIDGLPGSGKSTLAEALSTRMKMQWISLDYQMPEGKFFFKVNSAVYEHHRLLRTQNPDAFDVILFMDLPTETIKSQIIERGEGAVNIELFDFELMQEIGKMAFELSCGQAIQISGTNLLMKVKPKGGFGFEKNLLEKLKAKNLEAPMSLTQEEKLFLLIKGEPRKGLSGYHKGGQYARELFENVMQKMIQ